MHSVWQRMSCIYYYIFTHHTNNSSDGSVMRTSIRWWHSNEGKKGEERRDKLCEERTKKKEQGKANIGMRKEEKPQDRRIGYVRDSCRSVLGGGKDGLLATLSQLFMIDAPCSPTFPSLKYCVSLLFSLPSTYVFYIILVQLLSAIFDFCWLLFFLTGRHDFSSNYDGQLSLKSRDIAQ